ncbi:hypothetical protein PIB30_031142 [Stylosanthes scabra]|uniref:Uncharacterized protein n=1 Tax=Stylosanthes scabra TaxID=79078 RepID=A0ABU6YAL1_9FABA|nr:hypothetical protein [Stylosanthes scabra]
MNIVFYSFVPTLTLLQFFSLCLFYTLSLLPVSVAASGIFPLPPLRLPFLPHPSLPSFSEVLKRAARLYAASWVRDIGPDLRPEHYKKDEMTEEPNGEKKTAKGKEPSTLEDLAIAARGGMETLRPALQRVYMTRASAYRDALKSFIVGYQEGVQQVMEKKEDSKTQEDADMSKKST